MKGLGSAFIGLSKYLGASATATLFAPGLIVRSNAAGTTEGPTLALWRDNAAPAASDQIGEVLFLGEQSDGTAIEYARIYARIVDPTAAAEDGELRLQTVVSSAQTDQAIWPCPCFKVNRGGTDQSTLSGVQTDINWTTSVFNVGGYFSLATDSWTPPAGHVEMNLNVSWTGTNGDDGELLTATIMKNGASAASFLLYRNGAGSSPSLCITYSDVTTGTAAYSASVTKNGAGNGTIEGAASRTFFQGKMIQ